MKMEDKNRKIKREAEVSLAEMLEARERRVFRQQELMRAYPGMTLVCFTMNIAGPVKKIGRAHV